MLRIGNKEDQILIFASNAITLESAVKRLAFELLDARALFLLQQMHAVTHTSSSTTH